MKTLKEFVIDNFDGSYLELYKYIQKPYSQYHGTNNVKYNYHGDEIVFQIDTLKSKCFDELLNISLEDCDREMYESYQPIAVLYITRKKLKGLVKELGEQ